MVTRAECEVLQALVTLRQGNAQRLPDLAASYLSVDVDDPALRELAGLDLNRPVDADDARALLWQALGQLGFDRLPDTAAECFASYFYALLITRGWVTPTSGAELVARFVDTSPSTPEVRKVPEVMEIYGLDDVRGGGLYDDDPSGFEHSVRALAEAIVERHERNHDPLSDDALRRITSTLILW